MNCFRGHLYPNFRLDFNKKNLTFGRNNPIIMLNCINRSDSRNRMKTLNILSETIRAKHFLNVQKGAYLLERTFVKSCTLECEVLKNYVLTWEHMFKLF